MPQTHWTLNILSSIDKNLQLISRDNDVKSFLLQISQYTQLILMNKKMSQVNSLMNNNCCILCCIHFFSTPTQTFRAADAGQNVRFSNKSQ